MESIGPLRGQNLPSRLVVRSLDSGISVRYQILAPREIEYVCHGRSVEEIPRIASVLGASHHVVSAAALDRIYEIEPPPIAINIRQAFLYLDRFIHHVTKFFFFCDFAVRWFEINPGLANRRCIRTWKEIRNHLLRIRKLCKEAAGIVGGKNVLPVFCLPGGVSHALKDIEINRLEEIAIRCSDFAEHFSLFFNRCVLNHRDLWEVFFTVDIPGARMIALSPDNKNVMITDSLGQRNKGKILEFPLSEIDKNVFLQHVSWSHEPVVLPEDPESIDEGIEEIVVLLTGPLARQFIEKSSLRQEKKEESYSLSSFTNPSKGTPLITGYQALLIELLDTGSNMKKLFNANKLLSNDVRSIPKEAVRKGYAAVEGPNGLVYHCYEVQGGDVVSKTTVFDAERINVFFRSLLAKKLIKHFDITEKFSEFKKSFIEASLIPF